MNSCSNQKYVHSDLFRRSPTRTQPLHRLAIRTYRDHLSVDSVPLGSTKSGGESLAERAASMSTFHTGEEGFVIIFVILTVESVN